MSASSHIQNINGEQGGFTVNFLNPFLASGRAAQFARVVVACVVETFQREAWSGGSGYAGETLPSGYEIPGPITQLSVTEGLVDVVGGVNSAGPVEVLSIATEDGDDLITEDGLILVTE
jgi:hypothetical protein